MSPLTLCHHPASVYNHACRVDKWKENFNFSGWLKIISFSTLSVNILFFTKIFSAPPSCWYTEDRLLVCQGAVCTIRQLSSCTRSKINSWNNLGGQNSSITSSNVNHQYFKLYLISPHHGMGYFCFLDKWRIFVHKENKRLLHESENLLKCTSLLT